MCNLSLSITAVYIFMFDLRKLGVKRWRTKALVREEWASIIKEVKAKLKGPWCYRKKKKHPYSAPIRT